MWEPWPLATLGASTACNRDIFTFFFFYLLFVSAVHKHTYSQTEWCLKLKLNCYNWNYYDVQIFKKSAILKWEPSVRMTTSCIRGLGTFWRNSYAHYGDCLNENFVHSYPVLQKVLKVCIGVLHTYWSPLQQPEQVSVRSQFLSVWTASQILLVLDTKIRGCNHPGLLQTILSWGNVPPRTHASQHWTPCCLLCPFGKLYGEIT
jgi:hypothetical protein